VRRRPAIARPSLSLLAPASRSLCRPYLCSSFVRLTCLCFLPHSSCSLLNVSTDPCSDQFGEIFQICLTPPSCTAMLVANNTGACGILLAGELAFQIRDQRIDLGITFP